MPEPKAQLIDPQGPIDVPGMQVTGVTTATGGFVGQVQGAATGLASTTANLSVGIVTATKFQGNTTGNVSGLADDTNINVGIITSTSFTGDLVGNAAGLSTTTANINAGIMSATSFAGNFTGVASGITGTPNIVVGIMTGTLKGDGSSLTGIAATNWISNNVNATTSTTTVDLSDGNVVKFTQSASTTVSFANTGTSNIVSFIRSQTENFSTAGVTFDGSGDSLSIPDNADYNFGSGDFTIECWAKVNSINNYNDAFVAQWVSGQYCFYFGTFQADFRLFWSTNGSAESNLSSGYTVTTGGWHHYAASRSGDSLRLFVDGVQKGSTQDMSGVTLNDSTTTVVLGNNADVGDGSRHLNGILSNVRIIKGTGLYTSDFSPLMSDLTNVTNTKLLCCQSNSSTTAATVIPSGDSITANGDPTAGSQTISLAGARTITWPSSIKWNGGSAPDLVEINPTGEEFDLITLLTRDEGVTWYGWLTASNTRLDGTLWSWGYNDYGQLGQNNVNTTGISSPIQVPGSTWSSVITGGADHPASQSMGALKTDGTLWVMGQNTHGMLGQNNTTNYSSPVQIPGTTWKQASSPRATWTATKTDGTLWVWGPNGFGELGLSQPTNSHVSSPTQIPGTTWNYTDNSGYASFGIKTDGTLWSWGYNEGGVLGLSNKTEYSSPKQIPGTTWSTISANRNSAVATKTDGTLWAWGENPQGQLAQNNRSTYSSPKQIPGTSWSDNISMGYASCGAIRTDGTLWVWGDGHDGTLAQGPSPGNVDYSSPVQIPGTTWSKISMSSSRGAAIKTDGSLWTWGSGSKGVLGHNQVAEKFSPTQVPGTWTAIVGKMTSHMGIKEV